MKNPKVYQIKFIMRDDYAISDFPWNELSLFEIDAILNDVISAYLMKKYELGLISIIE